MPKDPLHPLAQNITVRYVFEDHHHLVDAPCHILCMLSLMSAGGEGEDDGLSSTFSARGPKSANSQSKVGGGQSAKRRILIALSPGGIDGVRNSKAVKKACRKCW